MGIVFLIQTVDEHLIVAGSDKRGTIYGIYDISEKIGVSPWYWWADVPVRKSTSLYVEAGTYIQSPKVKYRGIFINDEWPSFGGWASAKFGGLNAENMYVLANSPIAGVAVVSAVMKADNPRTAAEEIKEKFLAMHNR